VLSSIASISSLSSMDNVHSANRNGEDRDKVHTDTNVQPSQVSVSPLPQESVPTAVNCEAQDADGVDEDDEWGLSPESSISICSSSKVSVSSFSEEEGPGDDNRAGSGLVGTANIVPSANILDSLELDDHLDAVLQDAEDWSF
jgi:hypothetical protein